MVLLYYTFVTWTCIKSEQPSKRVLQYFCLNYPQCYQPFSRWLVQSIQNKEREKKRIGQIFIVIAHFSLKCDKQQEGSCVRMIMLTPVRKQPTSSLFVLPSFHFKGSSCQAGGSPLLCSVSFSSLIWAGHRCFLRFPMCVRLGKSVTPLLFFRSANT